MLSRKSKKIYILIGQIILFSSLICVIIKARRQLTSERKKANKYLRLYRLMIQWIELLQNGQGIAEWLERNGYTSVAIYGMHFIGERLYIELTDQGVHVAYGIDRLSRDYLEGIKMYRPFDDLPKVDVVIVTAVLEYENIKDELCEKINCPILSFEDILAEMLI